MSISNVSDAVDWAEDGVIRPEVSDVIVAAVEGVSSEWTSCDRGGRVMSGGSIDVVDVAGMGGRRLSGDSFAGPFLLADPGLPGATPGLEGEGPGFSAPRDAKEVEFPTLNLLEKLPARLWDEVALEAVDCDQRLWFSTLSLALETLLDRARPCPPLERRLCSEVEVCGVALGACAAGLWGRKGAVEGRLYSRRDDLEACER